MALGNLLTSWLIFMVWGASGGGGEGGVCEDNSGSGSKRN